MSDVITTKCAIIGSGPAGYTAAIYASRANLAPVLVDGPQPGGQLTTTSEVENFPGYPEGVDGNQLMADLRNQALRFGTVMLSDRVTDSDLSVRPFRLTLASGKIIATGASARYLGLPDEERFRGMGVSACAVCDGFFYRGKRVAVVGGGDTACEEAVYLAGLAQKVYMIVRKDHLRASKVMQQRVADNPKIEILFNTNTLGLIGEEFVEGAHLVEYAGTEQERRYDINIDGFFLAIGHQPNSAPFAKYVETDKAGYIITHGISTATSVDGVFAAGDVADPRFQQAVNAAAGCRAALEAERFILDKGSSLPTA